MVVFMCIANRLQARSGDRWSVLAFNIKCEWERDGVSMPWNSAAFISSSSTVFYPHMRMPDLLKQSSSFTFGSSSTAGDAVFALMTLIGGLQFTGGPLSH